MTIRTIAQTEKDLAKINATIRQLVEEANRLAADVVGLTNDVANLTADVVGPASSTDNAAARFDGATGKLLQDSALLIADTTAALSRAGAGGIAVQGTNTNDDASAGNVGEYLENRRLSASAISLTTATPADICSISLTAGDWDVWFFPQFTIGGTTKITQLVSGISTTSATLPIAGDTDDAYSVWFYPSGLVRVFQPMPVGPLRLSLPSAATVYGVFQANFTAGTFAAFGALRARRVR